MKKIALLVSRDNPFYREFFELQKSLNYTITSIVADHYRSDALLYATEQLVDHYTVEWHKGRETEDEYISRVNELVNTLDVDFMFATDWKHPSITTKNPFYYVNTTNDSKQLKNILNSIFESEFKSESEEIKKNPISIKLIKHGKVRDCYDVGSGIIALVHTDNQSAFDRHICTIPQKGALLTEVSANWFIKLNSIGIDTHYISHYSNVMFVKNCEMLPVEMVIRSYITGSTNTSLWTHYQNGEREYCGIIFPDGLKKNQKLEKVVITPSTKEGSDEAISDKDVIDRGLMTQDQFDYCSSLTYKIFKYGEEYALKHNLILADTKYEFGVDKDGVILLCDEVHTCDSSRFWFNDSYNKLFSEGKEPEKFDKDIIRDYVSERCDPYKESLPDIPDSLIDKAGSAYKSFYNMLFDQPFVYNEPKSLEELVNMR